MKKTIQSSLGHILHAVQSIFLSGLFTLLPITLTIALFTFCYRLIMSWLAPIYRWEPVYLQKLPGSQLIFVLLVIFIAGIIIRTFFLAPLFHAIESLFFKVPLMRQVYRGIKQLVHALSTPNELSFQKVVLVRFLGTSVYSIGFLTGQVPSSLLGSEERQFFHVFIPTTPNPTSGFLVQIAQEDLVLTQLTRQEAMSLIISGGIVQPERFKI